MKHSSDLEERCAFTEQEGSFDFDVSANGARVSSPKSESDAGKTAGIGHRSRLRIRLLKCGAEALADYEVLEYLLFAGIRQGDTKPVAKELLKQFGTLANVLNADPHALKRVKA